MADHTFDDIVHGINADNAFHGAVQEVRAELHRAHPGEIDLALIGHEAWRRLTPVQQAHALDGLFTAYIIRLHDEERAARLNRDAASGRTHLEDDDLAILHDAVAGAAPIGPDTEIDGVCASALANTLAELELLQRRVTNQEGS
ncbi:hypothetical protein ACMZ5F_11370 [Streptomyces rhizosphaericola]|uniref:hypothetical protein n=1 Tax=Streptomyces rhizosphaericola TaxID=2564098 RepID=UPI0039EF0F4D